MFANDPSGGIEVLSSVIGGVFKCGANDGTSVGELVREAIDASDLHRLAVLEAKRDLEGHVCMLYRRLKDVPNRRMVVYALEKLAPTQSTSRDVQILVDVGDGDATCDLARALERVCCDLAASVPTFKDVLTNHFGDGRVLTRVPDASLDAERRCAVSLILPELLPLGPDVTRWAAIKARHDDYYCHDGGVDPTLPRHPWPSVEHASWAKFYFGLPGGRSTGLVLAAELASGLIGAVSKGPGAEDVPLHTRPWPCKADKGMVALHAGPVPPGSPGKSATFWYAARQKQRAAYDQLGLFSAGVRAIGVVHDASVRDEIQELLDTAKEQLDELLGQIQGVECIGVVAGYLAENQRCALDDRPVTGKAALSREFALYTDRLQPFVSPARHEERLAMYSEAWTDGVLCLAEVTGTINTARPNDVYWCAVASRLGPRVDAVKRCIRRLSELSPHIQPASRRIVDEFVFGAIEQGPGVAFRTPSYDSLVWMMADTLRRMERAAATSAWDTVTRPCVAMQTQCTRAIVDRVLERLSESARLQLERAFLLLPLEFVEAAFRHEMLAGLGDRLGYSPARPSERVRIIDFLEQRSTRRARQCYGLGSYALHGVPAGGNLDEVFVRVFYHLAAVHCKPAPDRIGAAGGRSAVDVEREQLVSALTNDPLRFSTHGARSTALRSVNRLLHGSGFQAMPSGNTKRAPFIIVLLKLEKGCGSPGR